MNRSKNMIYGLALAVLSIWGVIMYRVFASVADAGGSVANSVEPKRTAKVSLPKLYPDTFNLNLNYPDPFTGEAAKHSVKAPDTGSRKPPVVNMAVAAVPIHEAPNPIEQLKYLGYVSDPRGKVKLAIVNFRGSERMMREGDTTAGIKLISVGQDALVVQHKGKRKTIKTQ